MDRIEIYCFSGGLNVGCLDCLLHILLDDTPQTLQGYSHLPTMADQNITLDDNLVANLSGILNSAGIPNFLWSNYLLTIYGVSTFVDVSIPIALKEKLLIPAGRDLRGSRWIYQNSLIPSHECKFLLNSVPKTFNRLPFLKRPPKTSPPKHLHITSDKVLAVCIYGKSDVLWELPDFQLPSSSPDLDTRTPDIWSASDPRLLSNVLGRGRLSPEFEFLWILSPVKYCEAVILLLCRDSDTDYEAFWFAMLTYIMEFLDDGSGIFCEEDLGEEFKGFYHAVKHGDWKMWVILEELRSELISRERLPSVE